MISLEGAFEAVWNKQEPFSSSRDVIPRKQLNGKYFFSRFYIFSHFFLLFQLLFFCAIN